MDDDHILEKGIQQLLGKEEYDPPTRLLVCDHISDGFIYEETPVFTTLRCTKCGEHYDILP